MGVIVVVSHDRYFLDRVCTKIFSYEGNGYIKEYHGNYSDFLISKEIEKASDITTSKNTSETKDDRIKNSKEKTKDNKPKFTFKEQKEYETIDDDILKLEEKIKTLETEMSKNSSNYGKLNELIKEKDVIQKELEFKYERWEYLNEIAEAIEEFKNNN
jgi:ATP-binding cassette subfamily F protein uup